MRSTYCPDPEGCGKTRTMCPETCPYVSQRKSMTRFAGILDSDLPDGVDGIYARIRATSPDSDQVALDSVLKELELRQSFRAAFPGTIFPEIS